MSAPRSGGKSDRQVVSGAVGTGAPLATARSGHDTSTSAPPFGLDPPSGRAPGPLTGVRLRGCRRVARRLRGLPDGRRRRHDHARAAHPRGILRAARVPANLRPGVPHVRAHARPGRAGALPLRSAPGRRVVRGGAPASAEREGTVRLERRRRRDHERLVGAAGPRLPVRVRGSARLGVPGGLARVGGEGRHSLRRAPAIGVLTRASRRGRRDCPRWDYHPHPRAK